jgi:hypothetical protein
MEVFVPTPLTNWLIELARDYERYKTLLRRSQLAIRFNVSLKDFKKALETEAWKARSLFHVGDIQEIWLFILSNNQLMTTLLKTMDDMSRYQQLMFNKIEHLRMNVLPIFCLEYYVHKHQVSLETGYLHFFSNPAPPKKKKISKADIHTQERKSLQRGIKQAQTVLTRLKQARRKELALTFIDQEIQDPNFQQAARVAAEYEIACGTEPD